MKEHKCGYSECTNCGKYVGKDHKCYLRKMKAKGGYCMTGNKEPCKNNDLFCIWSGLDNAGLFTFNH